jgi:Ca2+-binding RTX toxin-like protein
MAENTTITMKDWIDLQKSYNVNLNSKNFWIYAANNQLTGTTTEPGARGGAVDWGTALQAGSTPDAATGIFPRHNTSGRIMVPGSTQPLTEMSTTNISWEVKAAGA